MKAAILGSTGYTGMLLTRILASHPDIETLLPVSSSMAGSPIAGRDGGFAESAKLTSENYLSLDEMLTAGPDVIFAGLPHLKSSEICGPLVGSAVVIDLSADFRIQDAELFAAAYGVAAPRPPVPAVYGLSEWYGAEIRQADLIANPGCYPTATLLPLLPFLARDLVRGAVVINALSGISGAGRKKSENLLFCERSENAGPYAPGTSHRHWAEMIDQTRQNQSQTELFFTPHLIPVRRGMEVTTTFSLAEELDSTAIESLLAEAYGDKVFVRLRRDKLPETREVWGSNRCDIGWRLEGRRVFLFSCIDNLVKGASGQAVQNMNLRFGFEETAGLALSGLV